MTTLTAPDRMRGRDQARELLREIATDLAGVEVVFSIPDGSLPTASFIDQIVSDILVARGAARLVVLTASKMAGSVARDSADSLGVADRIAVDDELDIESIEQPTFPV